ncbi:SMR family transporter [Pseudolysinimonas sp.]|uniref:DMT family transporter n=1 Tax=Pseudolysinimonas sp. TaxID=2680009 RepID=UPI00286A111D|nr:SMR family transporter [Pseudolysinimonas sp.]
MLKWLLLGGAIVAEVAGSLSLKGALEQPLLYVVVVVGYLAAFVLLALVLRAGIPVGVAYGIWGALGVALTALLSALIFGEPLTPLMIVGMALVIVGVLCVEIGSGHASRAKAEVES